MIVEAGGNKYFVAVEGSGDPLVLLHGFTGSSRSWEEHIPVLASSYKVIAIDLLGHGKTGCPANPASYEMEAVAADLAEIFGRLGLDKVHLLGYSMGGRLALGFSVLFPHLVRSLILESSSPGLKTPAEREDRMNRDVDLASFILEKGMDSFVDRWENIPLFESQKRLPRDARLKVRQERLRNNPAGLANSLLGMGTGRQPSFWAQLPKLQMPVLLLCGSLDEKFCKLAAEMKNSIPNAALEIVQKAGHAVHVEEPEKFGTIVNGFLQRLQGDGQKK